jgi:hypothetical protein
MAFLPWRIQGDITKGETDPPITVFTGVERAVVDDDGKPTGDTFIEQNTSNPVVLKLSEVPTALADPTMLTEARKVQKLI